MSTVLAFSCTHCPAMRKGFVRFLQGVADKWQPDRIVCLGDVADWHAISFHEHNPDCRSPGDEYKTTKKQVQELVKAFPKADCMIGNHDALVHRKAATAGLPSGVIKGFKEQWDIPWRVHDRYAELMIDGVVYTHLEGPHGPGGLAVVNRAKLRYRSMVGGHFHSEGGVQYFANDEFRLFGLAVGCGADRHSLQMAYGKPIPKKPLLGCGVVEKGLDAHFLPWHLKSR